MGSGRLVGSVKSVGRGRLDNNWESCSRSVGSGRSEGKIGSPVGKRSEKGSPVGKRLDKGSPPGKKLDRGRSVGKMLVRGRPPGKRSVRGNPFTGGDPEGPGKPGMRSDSGKLGGNRPESGNPVGSGGRPGRGSAVGFAKISERGCPVINGRSKRPVGMRFEGIAKISDRGIAVGIGKPVRSDRTASTRGSPVGSGKTSEIGSPDGNTMGDRIAEMMLTGSDRMSVRGRLVGSGKAESSDGIWSGGSVKISERGSPVGSGKPSTEVGI